MFWSIVGALIFVFYGIPLIVSLLFSRTFWVIIGWLFLGLIGLIILLISSQSKTNNETNQYQSSSNSQGNGQKYESTVASSSAMTNRSVSATKSIPISIPLDTHVNAGNEPETTDSVLTYRTVEESEVNPFKEDELVNKPAIPNGFFTIGSTKKEVLAAQGTPSSVFGELWYFGASSVTFSNGLVASYSNISNNLRVTLVPTTDVRLAKARGYFTMGSSKDEVFVVQGVPDSIFGDLRYFGASSVTFSDGHVTSYSNISGNLKVSYE